MELQCSKWKIGVEINDFVFSDLLLLTYALQSTFVVLFSLHNIFSVHLWSYSVTNGKLALKLTICIFNLHFAQMLTHFQLYDLLRPIYALQSTCLVFFCLHNHFINPFMDLQCFKWTIGLKIDDFIFLTFFAQILALFAALRDPKTDLRLTKYIFGIVLFARPFFQSIYGFKVLQMENWPQN